MIDGIGSKWGLAVLGNKNTGKLIYKGFPVLFEKDNVRNPQVIFDMKLLQKERLTNNPSFL